MIDHGFRDSAQVEDFDVGEDAFGVGLEPGKQAGLGAGGEDDVLGGERLGALVRLHFDLGCAVQHGAPFDDFHFVLLHEEVDALGVLGDDLVLVVDDLGEIEAGIVAGDAVGGGVQEVLPDLCGVEESLGGDTTDQQTGAAEARAVLDQGGAQPVLAGADGGGISTGSASDDDHVVSH